MLEGRNSVLRSDLSVPLVKVRLFLEAGDENRFVINCELELTVPVASESAWIWLRFSLLFRLGIKVAAGDVFVAVLVSFSRSSLRFNAWS